MNLTPKQLKILQLIRDTRVRCGYSPTMQELADELRVSKVTVFEHVEALIKKGALRREANKARSLSLCEDAIVPDEAAPDIRREVEQLAGFVPHNRCFVGNEATTSVLARFTPPSLPTSRTANCCADTP